MAKKPLFYKIYFCVIAVFVAALTAGLFVLHSFLKTYEASQPESAVNTLIEKYLEKGDIYSLKEKYSLKLSDFETEENANAAFKNLIGDSKDLKLYKTVTPSGYDLAYCIKSNDTRILNVYLSKDKKYGKFGLSGYTVSLTALPESMYKTATVHTYSLADTYINGKKADGKLLQNEQLPKLPKMAISGNINYKQSAKFEYLLNENIKLTAKYNGSDLETEIKDGVYFVKGVYDDLSKECKNTAIEAAKAYTAYMQNDTSFANVSKYLLPDTEFYKNVKTSMVIFAWEHNGYEFENVKSGDIHKFTDNLYSVRVSLTQVLKLGAKRYRDNFDKYVYLIKTDNGFKVVDMQSAEE